MTNIFCNILELWVKVWIAFDLLAVSHLSMWATLTTRSENVDVFKWFSRARKNNTSCAYHKMANILIPWVKVYIGSDLGHLPASLYRTRWRLVLKMPPFSNALLLSQGITEFPEHTYLHFIVSSELHLQWQPNDLTWKWCRRKLSGSEALQSLVEHNVTTADQITSIVFGTNNHTRSSTTPTNFGLICEFEMYP